MSNDSTCASLDRSAEFTPREDSERNFIKYLRNCRYGLSERRRAMEHYVNQQSTEDTDDE